VQDDGDRGGNVDEEEAEENPDAPPKFQILQKVYARDKDGVMYKAVIRRQLYGPQYHRQVAMGLVTSKEEAQELLEDVDHEPIWHYFVHYTKWNVSFDRWVSENDIFEMSDQIIAYAKRLSTEHRALQLEMKKPGINGIRQRQTINGAVFLRKWKNRMLIIDKEMNVDHSGDKKSADNDDYAMEPEVLDADAEVASHKPLKQNTWTKAALASELTLRGQGLTGKRPQSQSNAVVMILVCVAVRFECDNIKTGLHPLHESDMKLTFPTADQSLPQFHHQGGSGQKRIQRIVV
jgi:hypothetical protein